MALDAALHESLIADASLRAAYSASLTLRDGAPVSELQPEPCHVLDEQRVIMADIALGERDVV